MSVAITLCGASVRAAAFSALRAGFSPYAIDLFADRDLAAVCPVMKIDHYPDDFEAALSNSPDAPWIYTGGLENYPQLVDRLSKIRPLWGNGGEVLRRIRDPRQLARVLAGNDLAYPSIDPADFGEAQWLRKPLAGSAGLGTRMATGTDLRSRSSRHFFQQYIAGQAASAVFVAANGRAVLLGTTKQLIGCDWALSPPFVYLGSIGPLALSEIEESKLNRLGSVLANEFGLVGLFNVDLVQTPDECWTVEVNPRYSASMEVLERATGANFVAMHATACQSGQLPETTSTYHAGFCGKAVVYADRECRWPAELDRNVHDKNDNRDWPLIADIPPLGQAFSRGQPVATVFAAAGSPEQVERSLHEVATELLGQLIPPAG